MPTVRDNPFASEELVGNQQDQLRAAKEVIAGPVPLMSDAPDCSLVLPRGLYIQGMFKTNATVRELTGTDEESLAKQREPNDYFDLVIALGVERIDDFDLGALPVAERQGHLRTLLIGERDMLFLAVVKATFGERKTLGFKCQTCGEEQEIDLLLSDDFKPKITDDLAMSYAFTTSKGVELEYRLANGEDQREAFARKGATTAEQNTVILSRCIISVSGGLVVDPLGFARKLSIKDRQLLLDGLISRQPTIDLGVTTTCAACGADQALALGWMDLFRP